MFSSIDIAGGLENLQKICAAHDVLRSVGICYVAVYREYFVTVHGVVSISQYLTLCSLIKLAELQNQSSQS